MYNSFTRGTEAWFAAKEAIDAVQTLEDAEGVVESTFENLLGQLDDALNTAEEMETERDDFEEKCEKLEAELEVLKVDKEMLINELTKMKIAAESVVTYTTNKLVEMGALNESTTADGSTGTGSDGSSQGADNETGGGQGPAEG